MKITVLSAGTWGITLAALLEQNGHQVSVWEYDPKVIERIQSSGTHPRLPDLKVPSSIAFSTEMGDVLDQPEMIVCVVPAAHMRQTCLNMAAKGYLGQPFVICTKGIEQETLLLMSDVARDTLGEDSVASLAVLSGPSHAEEVSRGLPTAVTACATDEALALFVQTAFMNERFRVYSQTDLIGVELGAALKNVIAISCGISDGLGYGDNAKAALITRGLYEIVRLGARIGAEPETFYGLTGMGDLVVTCMSQHSRNWKFGNLIGKGLSPEAALDEVGMVVEGQYTVKAAVALAAKHHVDMPISQAVHAVLFGGLSPEKAVASLMLRDRKSEDQN